MLSFSCLSLENTNNNLQTCQCPSEYYFINEKLLMTSLDFIVNMRNMLYSKIIFELLGGRQLLRILFLKRS